MEEQGIMWDQVVQNKWDAFRSKPRSKRIQKVDVFYIHWLQWIKLIIFFVSHCSCLMAVILSKGIVLVLATNIGMKTYTRRSLFYRTCAPPLENQNFDRLSCLCAALWLIQVVPDICAFLQDMWQIKISSKDDHSLVFMVVALESCRAAGLAILTMIIFPLLDVPRCVLLSCAVLFIPHLQDALRQIRRSFDLSRSIWWRFGKIISSIPSAVIFVLLFSGAYIWCLLSGLPSVEFGVLLPLSFVLCAIGYWESWIDEGHSQGIFHGAYEVKYGIRKLNSETRMCSYILRFIFSSVVLYWSLRHHNIPLGTLISVFFKWEPLKGPRRLFIWSFVALLANFYLRVSFRFLAAMRVKLLDFAHPVLLCMPLLFLWSYSICNVIPICQLNTLLHSYGLSFYCTKGVAPSVLFSDYYVSWTWLAAYVFWSYYFINGDPIDHSDEIIESMSPMLSGLDICQSIIVFHHAVNKKDDYGDSDDDIGRGELRIVNGDVDKIVTLYVCATCWHETRTEMVQMIKSIIMLDEEHAVRLAEKDSSHHIKFRLEVHIFFDDAWVDDKECGRIPNEYFKLLFEILMELTSSSDGAGAEMFSRILVNTSYGGRLVLTLGAGALLFVHLKDKKLIRHKKRWSQVMYMYYLLGHRIMDSHLSVEDRQLQAENTYILAIDGDSKFEPQAVIKLLHLMDIKSDVGCACGRIHPIGEGVMVWYQKFEYAIAHWFQKAAEHVFGCVLCAPGCFSLFRASALMDDNVMHTYTKTASEPRHYVQYDQGEDRWLSTLLLKQGYRIEYAAAADAETYAPEGFDEFFNQRRRWTPSSIANTLDLLGDYKLASKNNRSISKLYILYQMIVIGLSLLGPAIIFTMLVYAQVSAFAMDSSRVLLYNAVPVCLFILSCFFCESNIQLMFAKISSVVYAFIMLAVLVATTQQIVLETIFSPTSAFVLAMVLIFLSASFVHPKEFPNIIYGAIFFLMIPSTYVFLSLYSLINLNVINWGTREAVAKATGRASDEPNQAGKMIGRVRRFFKRFQNDDKSDDKIRDLESKLESMEKKIQDSSLSSNKSKPTEIMNLDVNNESNRYESMAIRQVDKGIHIGNQQDPSASYRRTLWMDCEYLQSCDRGILRLPEESFWDELIDKYLTLSEEKIIFIFQPVESTPEQQTEIASSLVTLRNRIAFSILLLNGLLVLAVFLLQRHKDVLSIKLTPYDGFIWTKMNETTGKFEATTEALKVDPLGMGIIFFLLGILIVQTIGMLIHRLNTLVEALHELSEMKDQNLYGTNGFDAYKSVLDAARQMIDTVSYDRAHGADGYVRSGLGESKAQRNVLYKLQTQEDR